MLAYLKVKHSVFTFRNDDLIQNAFFNLFVFLVFIINDFDHDTKKTRHEVFMLLKCYLVDATSKHIIG